MPVESRMEKSDSSMRRYIALDGWRGICAMGVVLFHFPKIFWLSNIALISSGWLFVDFFFVLSGFVITHAYGSKIKDISSILDFMKRRFFRLYPLHLGVFFVSFGFILIFDTARLLMSKKLPGFNLTNLFSEFSFERIAMHLSLLQGFFADWADVGFNTPSWSISAEFWTYAVFAACCIGLRTRTVAAQCLLAVACLSLLYLWPDLGQSRVGTT